MLKRRKLIGVLIMVTIISIYFSACGNNNSGNNSTEPVGKEVEVIIPEPTPEPTPAPVSTATDDTVIGEWVDINSSDCFVKITQIGDSYQYEDNDGQYPATYKDGILTVNVTDTDTAKVFVDANSKHLFTEFQGNKAELRKK